MDRRRVLLGALGSFGLGCIGPAVAHGKPAVPRMAWDDLLPSGTPSPRLAAMRADGIVPHADGLPPFTAPEDSATAVAAAGRRGTLRGYTVPWTVEDTGVTQLILAPYVGACWHVPPPPANQLLHVFLAEPFRFTGLYDLVDVTGVIALPVPGAGLPEIAYTMVEARARPVAAS